MGGRILIPVRLIDTQRTLLASIFVALFVALSLAGCGVALEDGVKDDNPIALSEPEQDCLATSLPAIERYFQGTASADETERAWDCFSGALKLFTKHTRGASAKHYTAHELRTFLQTYFLGDLKISDPLLTEAMRVKSIILGGAIENVTREELERADVLLQAVKVETLKLRPYMQIYMIDLPIDADGTDAINIETAIQQLESSTSKIGNLLAGSVTPYQLNDLSSLLDEVYVLYKDRGGWEGPKWLRDHLTTFSALKAFFIRPGGNQIAPSEWPELWSEAARLYGLWLRVHYLLDTERLTTGKGLSHLITTFHELFEVIESSIKAKVNSVIEYKEIDDLLTELYRLEIFEMPTSQATLTPMIRTVFERVYNPQVKGKRAVKTGLDLAILEGMRDDFFGWAEMQQTFDWAEKKTRPFARVGLPLLDLRTLWTEFPGQHKRAAEDVVHLLTRPFPLTYTPEGVLYFDPDVTTLRMDQEAFTSLNWKRAFIRAVSRAYSFDPEEYRFKGITQNEFRDFYVDVKPLAVEIGFLDPSNENFWKSTFEESNIFLFSADANEFLSFSEGVELISFALSGSKMSRRSYRDMRAKCKNYESDVYGLPKVDVNCYRKMQRENFAYYYEWMENWNKEVKKLTNEGWAEFQISIEKAARKHGHSARHLESGDIDKTTGLIQYIESLYLRFDADRSGTINLSESRGAYPLLRNLLAEVSGFDDEEDLFALFTYLLAKGEAPTKDIWGGIKFYWWKLNPSTWKFEATRVSLMKTFGNISAEME